MEEFSIHKVSYMFPRAAVMEYECNLLNAAHSGILKCKPLHCRNRFIVMSVLLLFGFLTLSNVHLVFEKTGTLTVSVHMGLKWVFCLSLSCFYCKFLFNSQMKNLLKRLFQVSLNWIRPWFWFFSESYEERNRWSCCSSAVTQWPPSQRSWCRISN